MGSEYILYEDENIEVSIGEMSNKLSLNVCDIEGEDTTYKYTKDMAPAEMLKIFMEGIKVCSYWMFEEEFNEVFSKLETYAFRRIYDHQK